MHSIISILTSLPVLISVLASLVLGSFYFWLRADNFRFTSFAYKRPWVPGNDHSGEFQRLSKESGDSVVDENGLVHAEGTLCQTFKAVIAGSSNAEVTAEQFNRAKSYLKITQQNDVHPPSMLARVGLFVLILAESVGTGYVLAPWLSNDITPARADMAAAVLALAVAIVLAIMTHVAGAEAAKFFHYRKRAGSEGLGLPIDLGDDQDQDAFYIDPNTGTVKQNPLPRRFANRVDDPGAWGPVLLAIVTGVVVTIMVVIFVHRVAGVESEATKQIVSMEANGVADSGSGSSPFDTASSSSLPPDVVAAQQQTRRTVAESLGGDYKTQGMTASIMLALIYLVTQFTAFIVAFKSTFSGQGEAAYSFTRNQPSFDTFRAKFLMPKIARAESFLTQLRDARKKKSHRIGTGRFEDFLKSGEAREASARDNLITRAAAEISTGKTDDDRELHWELALKNYNFSSEEQTILVQKCEEAHVKKDRIRLRERTHDASLNPVGAASVMAPVAVAGASSHTVAAGNASSPVVDTPAIDKLARDFLQLPDKQAKTEFLAKQQGTLGEANFQLLAEEIKRQKELAKATEKYGDLLED
ncbi:hypothetical protein B0G57_12384 [Trinickia symbiotica]|uniref:Uncharacterized protein n=1 Tax=Trinickia symbiotica TaxID=863227 RepID=A0A2N7WRU3_9BURK|nr:hypothetical protein [Trinickia symbiotica]PMS32183.1 hypothetical protein C0Z20_27235 [Trinickia symbiotica]PPK41989.1 hypothetical protein B0G57_12384 [Trinickia symbiotica]